MKKKQVKSRTSRSKMSQSKVSKAKISKAKRSKKSARGKRVQPKILKQAKRVMGEVMSEAMKGAVAGAIEGASRPVRKIVDRNLPAQRGQNNQKMGMKSSSSVGGRSGKRGANKR